MDEILPGQVVSPNAPQNNTVESAASTPVQAHAVPAAWPPVSTPATQQTTVSASLPEQQPAVAEIPQQQTANIPSLAPQHTSSFVNSKDVAQNKQPTPSPQPEQQQGMAWSASEFIRQEKDARWYVIYLFALIALSVVVYVFTKDLVSTGVVFIALLGLLFLSIKKPEIQDFSVNEGALSIGRKVYYLHDFKAFSVLDEGSIVEVTLLPLKRFMPPVSLCVQPDRADELATYLADYLPFEPRKSDAMDVILRRIRF